MNINKAKLLAYAEIDAIAGAVRKRFITDAAGQQAVYLRKLEEARLYVDQHASSPTTASPGPHIAAEATELGVSALQVAETVIAINLAWTQEKSPTIEAKRIGGKARVRAASTLEDVHAELVAAVAALDAVNP